jgi:4-amino-4-deoxy-L-arabinose transferase-like glycosyltransferase
LTYHEAFVAQAAREMIASGDLLTPTIGGRPWLEKPPLAVWLVALTGLATGGVGESAARLPSAVAAALLVVGVVLLASRRFGASVGLLAGLVQVTTAWTVTRGRLAEADMLLACLVTWSLVAFDRLRTPAGAVDRRRRWAFFALLGLTSLAKGVGFGAVLVLAVVALVLAWDRDRGALAHLRPWRGWGLAGGIALAWPTLAALRHPSALRLWALHVTDRLASRPTQFTGEPWSEYLPALVVMVLPWAPLALAGAWRSLPRALGRGGRGGGDRLLWAWAVGPLVLLSMATVKQAHYAIHALPPCSVWAAFGLTRLGARLQERRGWSPGRVRRATWAAFGGLGLAYALGFALLAPRLDRRGVEWAFYHDAARLLRPGEPVALLYHVPEWDRFPYETPFGPVPHDWAVRLFYLNGHPAPCLFRFDELPAGPTPFAVIGRPSDLPGLSRLGRVETLAQGPPVRSDRTYRLYRVTPASAPVAARDADADRR